MVQQAKQRKRTVQIISSMKICRTYIYYIFTHERCIQVQASMLLYFGCQGLSLHPFWGPSQPSTSMQHPSTSPLKDMKFLFHHFAHENASDRGPRLAPAHLRELLELLGGPLPEGFTERLYEAWAPPQGGALHRGCISWLKGIQNLYADQQWQAS